MIEEHAQLREIVSFVSGGTPSRAKSEYFDGEIPWVTGADLGERGTIAPRSFISTEAVKASAVTLVPPGTLLLVTRTSVGKVAVADRTLGFSQDITALKHDEEKVDAEYLRAFLASFSPRLKEQARGATIQGVTRNEVGSILVPLPPLAEQRRIAAILDQADELRTQRRKALALLDELETEIFAETFESYFSTDARIPFGEVVADIQNGLYVPSRQYGSGISILRIADFEAGARLRLEGLLRVSITSAKLSRFALAEGDIVINRVNAMSHVGKSALIVAAAEPAVFESNMMRVRLNTARVLPEFVSAWLHTSEARGQMQSSAKQAINQASVNQRDIRALRMPSAPIKVQQAFAEDIQKIARARSRQIAHLARLEELFASLQNRAFSAAL